MEIYNSGNIKINIDSPFFKDEYVNFLLKIKAYQFCGEHNFCININDLKELISKLHRLYNDMRGEVKLTDYDSESFICLQIIGNSDVCLVGQLGSELEDNMWIFKHNVDQTIIKLLLNCFNEFVILAQR